MLHWSTALRHLALLQAAAAMCCSRRHVLQLIAMWIIIAEATYPSIWSMFL